jgi:hypothetical protein
MNDHDPPVGYWPGQDNSCEVKGCGGAGTPEHIDHVLRAMPLRKLMGRILSHCEELSQHHSCLCCHYAREIGRRAGMKE